MNYRYVIALFAGDEVDNWEAPTSVWMLAGDGATGWTDEFMRLKHLKEKNELTKKITSIDMMMTTADIGYYDWRCNLPDKFYFYNEEKDVMLLISKKRIEKLGEEIFTNFIDENFEELKQKLEIQIPSELL